MFNITKNINQEQNYISEYIEMGDGVIAHRYNICSTPFISYAVYRRMEGLQLGRFSTMTHTEEYGWLGDMTTECLPVLMDKLPPRSAERSKAVRAWHDGLDKLAEAYVRAAFPNDFKGE